MTEAMREAARKLRARARRIASQSSRFTRMFL
jgi:hypothetical protein